jgi:hypothetical protein
MESLVKLLNEKRDPDLPPLENRLGWEQKGPKVQTQVQEDSTASEAKSSVHLEKYNTCGRQCFDLARTYYRSDLEKLGYPQTMEDLVG